MSRQRNGSSESMLDEQTALPEIPPAPETSESASTSQQLASSPPTQRAPGFGASADKREPFMPVKMTVGQYLKRQPQGAGISDLIRSLYSTKVMSFGEWENTVKALLKKHVK